jgi:N4-gp56 family major capsid protein|tara:strand:- start:1190 stop:2050 length:861 start_codon:yes stop_codon:yes gene_type:complete
MALGTNHVTGSTAAAFIPELWSDEVIAGYKKNLVLANLVTRMSHVGKKGDSIHIPSPSRGAANAKAASTQVVLNSPATADILVLINKHYEYSTLIEDIVEKQALSSLRRFYTDDAGYALATQVDTDLFALVPALNGGTQLGGDGGSSSADITDAGIRKFMLVMDNNDVPMTGRSLVIPPVAKSDLLGIARFTEQAFVGNGNAIKTGMIGNVYGVEVFVSSACPVVNATRIGVMLHKDALVLAEQQSVRSQTQYQQQYLGDLFTADTIYGVKELRDNAGISFIVPSA